MPLEKKRLLKWEQILELAKWVVERHRNEPVRTDEYKDLDPGWGWTRKRIANLLGEGFKYESGSPIPFELRESAWEILEPLTNDQEPTKEDEENKRSFDYSTLSINCVRSIALHTMMEYALWIYRYYENENTEYLKNGFGMMPEVCKVLNYHLNIGNDPSLAVRSVYGRLFNNLAFIDFKWARENVGKIFPKDPELSDYWKVAWKDYITYCRPYDLVFEILFSTYDYALDNMGTWDSEGAFLNPDNRLGEHLIIFYLREKIDFKDPENLLTKFYSKATDDNCSHIMRFVGDVIKAPYPELQQDLLLLKSLWEIRINKARKSPSDSINIKEISGFGYWFVTGKFEDKWSLENLQISLEIAGKIDPDSIVIERISELSEKFPKESVRCLKLMAETKEMVWRSDKWYETAKDILRNAQKSGDTEVKNEAIDLINFFGTKGRYDFRELL